MRGFNEDYLLRLVEVGDVSLGVDPSAEVARASAIARTSADEAEVDPATANIGLTKFKA